MPKKIFFKLLIIVSAICLIINLPIPQAKADISVSPYNTNRTNKNETNWFVYKAKAGDTINDSILIQNSGNNSTTVALSGKDSAILEDGTFTIIPDNQSNKSTGNWINLNVNKVVIEAKKTSQISFQINVPKDTKDGQYSAGISTIEQQDSGKATSTQASIVKRYGLRIYILVGQKFNLDLRPQKIHILSPLDDNYLQQIKDKPYFGRNNLIIQYQAENKGNVFGTIRGKYSLTKQDGSVYENTFSAEIAPNSGVKNYYIITNQPYNIGKTEAIVNFEVSPQTAPIEIVNNVRPKTALGDTIDLDQNSWNKFANSSVQAFTANSSKESAQDYTTKTEFNKTLLLSLVMLINLFAAFIFWKKVLWKLWVEV